MLAGGVAKGGGERDLRTPPITTILAACSIDCRRNRFCSRLILRGQLQSNRSRVLFYVRGSVRAGCVARRNGSLRSCASHSMRRDVRSALQPGRKRPSIVVARRMWPGARHALSEAGIGWVVGSTDKESIRWLNLTLESAILRH